jgi:FdhD protein
MLPRKNIARFNVQKLAGSELKSAADVAAVEEPLEIRVSLEVEGKRVEKPLSVTMRTPGDDFELAAGFLFTEGVIAGDKDIHEISYCAAKGREEQRYNIVSVKLRPGGKCDAERLQRNFFMTSSCGICGKTSIDSVRTQATLAVDPAGPRVSSSILLQMPEKLRVRQPLFEKTGGIHGAGLFEADGTLIAVKEDVGRHNAVDKLIGEQLLNSRLPLNRQVLLVSGRASFEIMQKARMAAIGFIAAVGAPSSLAVDFAREMDMTLVGFLRVEKFNVYAGEARVTA